MLCLGFGLGVGGIIFFFSVCRKELLFIFFVGLLMFKEGIRRRFLFFSLDFRGVVFVGLGLVWEGKV